MSKAPNTPSVPGSVAGDSIRRALNKLRFANSHMALNDLRILEARIRSDELLREILTSPQADWLVMESWAQALEGAGLEVYAGQVRILANAIREAVE